MPVAAPVVLGASRIGFCGRARHMAGLIGTGTGRIVMRRNSGTGRFNHTNRTGRRHE
jgi:hypothetical protein